MPNKLYDYKTLVETYIQTQHAYYLHEDFKNYYLSLLEKLETVFELKITWTNSRDAALWMLFDATIRSYLSITSPYSKFLEMSAIYDRLKHRHGQMGLKILSEGDQIEIFRTQNEELHLQMLYDLFEVMYGKIDRVITSQELKELGFDDSTEPHSWDDKYADLL